MIKRLKITHYHRLEVQQSTADTTDNQSYTQQQRLSNTAGMSASLEQMHIVIFFFPGLLLASLFVAF